MMDGTVTSAAPWERQPGESPKAYRAFCIYRDMPPEFRSLRAVADRYYGGAGGGTVTKRLRVPGQIQKWSIQWRWVERARAWDDEQDRIAREEHRRAIREMRERHAREAVALQQKALERLRSLNPDDLSPRDLLSFIVEAAKLERISRGEPETIQEQRSDWIAAVLAAWPERTPNQAGA